MPGGETRPAIRGRIAVDIVLQRLRDLDIEGLDVAQIEGG
jgi:hypothetical protein